MYSNRDEVSAVLTLGGRDAAIAAVHLKPIPNGRDGNGTGSPKHEVLACSLCELPSASTIRMKSPFDIVVFIIPTTALHRWADYAGVRNFSGLHFPVDRMMVDDVLANFALAVFPSLEEPGAASRPFIDYMLQAVCAHLVATYGNTPHRADKKGGLAPWQERRAKAKMTEAADLRISLGQLAGECGLSVCHFVTAFRKSTGDTPYQWHLKRRIERAMSLLTNGFLPLVTIAAECGFADQSHFTRAFSKHVGISPGAWRRQSKGVPDQLMDGINCAAVGLLPCPSSPNPATGTS
jgi:AraC-like DNA-binding protein